jgi:hypothetical protein
MYIIRVGTAEQLRYTSTASDRAKLARIADFLAVLTAASLPWSTSATSVLLTFWLVAVIPTPDRQSVCHAITCPAGAFTLALSGLMILGMTWGDVVWAERFLEIKSSLKLLVIPLLLIEFRRSDNGAFVLGAYVASCTVLLFVSWALWLFPSIAPAALVAGSPGKPYIVGLPVKEYIAQSSAFIMCAFGLSHWTIDAWGAGRYRRAWLSGFLVVLFLANVFFVVTARTSLAIYAVLIVVIAFQRFGRKAGLAVIAAGLLLIAGAFAASPYLRARVFAMTEEMQQYRESNAETSTGARLEFWKKSITFVATAPILGHGTGSITELFRRAAVGEAGLSAMVTGNPHNVTLQVAIQFGVLGVAVVYAMWVAQLFLFHGSGLVNWVGFGVVLQGIIGSLTHSYIFDFTTGWSYVFGVGVLGGMALGTKKPDHIAPETAIGSEELGFADGPLRTRVT